MKLVREGVQQAACEHEEGCDAGQAGNQRGRCHRKRGMHLHCWHLCYLDLLVADSAGHITDVRNQYYRQSDAIVSQTYLANNSMRGKQASPPPPSAGLTLHGAVASAKQNLQRCADR